MKVTFGYRQITEYKSDILVIPYKDLKLGVYPGNLISKITSIDYRKKIKEKIGIDHVGSFYPQKCVEVPNFKAFGFLKIGDNNVDQNVAEIFPSINLMNKAMSSILIPYSKDMGPAKSIINSVFNSVSKYKVNPNKINEVHISTNDGQLYQSGLRAFC